MEEIISGFGVQPIYLAAQIVNFLILLLILKRFMYKPILKVLEDRKTTVANNLSKAKELEQQLLDIKEESDIKLSLAAKEAHKIIDKASNTANLIINEAQQKAETEIEFMLKKGRVTLSQEREKMQEELRQELANLVLIGTKKLTSKILDESGHKKIIEQTIEEMGINGSAEKT